MSSIKYKGQTYSGSSSVEDASHVVATDISGNLTTVQALLDAGAGIVELTQAQYDALPTATKNDGRIYAITDGTSTALAEDVYYDNTNSKLTSSNVQDAMDELSLSVFGDFASIEASNTASKAYAVGDYFVYDSKFYRVTSAIEQGDTIVPDTNVVQTTVGEEVKALDEKTDPVYIINSPLADLQTTLQSNWSTAFPADGIPRLAKVSATGGDLYGTINLYGYGEYGSGLLTRYDGSFYKVKLVAGTVTVTAMPDSPVVLERRQATYGAIAAGSQIEVKMDLSKAGYTSVPGYAFTVSGCIVNNIYNQNAYNDGRVQIRNMTSAAVSSGTVYVNMVYVKT